MYDSIAHAAGHAAAVPITAVLLVGLWLAFGTEATNFAISVASLLLLFMLQSTQNRDGLAIQAKLDAIIKGVPDAPNEMAGIDRLSEKEVERKRDV